MVLVLNVSYSPPPPEISVYTYVVHPHSCLGCYIVHHGGLGEFSVYTYGGLGGVGDYVVHPHVILEVI